MTYFCCIFFLNIFTISETLGLVKVVACTRDLSRQMESLCSKKGKFRLSAQYLWHYGVYKKMGDVDGAGDADTSDLHPSCFEAVLAISPTLPLLHFPLDDVLLRLVLF